MKMHAEHPRHPLEADSPLRQADPEKLPKPERIEPALSPKPRESRLAAQLHPPEEALIRLVERLQGPALQRDGKGRRFRVAVPPFRERLALVDVRARDPGLAVGIDSLFETGVVQLPLALQDGFEDPVLTLGGQEPIAICEDHKPTVRAGKLAK